MNAPVHCSSLRILLVEDGDADALFVRRGLARLATATQLYVTATGEEAMAYLGCDRTTEAADAPDLVILDLNLPGMKGLELLECIRRNERLKDLCVVILTSSSSPQDIDRAKTLGADDYLLKPGSLTELFKLLEELEDRWLKRFPLSFKRNIDSEAWPRG